MTNTPHYNKHLVFFHAPTPQRVLWIYRNRGLKQGFFATLSMFVGKYSHLAFYINKNAIWHQYFGFRRDQLSDLPKKASWTTYDIYEVPQLNYNHIEALAWCKDHEGTKYDYTYWFGSAVHQICKWLGKTFTININDTARTHCFETGHKCLNDLGVLPYEPLPTYIRAHHIIDGYKLKFVCSGRIPEEQ